MNLTPGNVVANGHGCRYDHSLVSRQTAIVRRGSSEQHRVRQSDLLMSRRSQLGCKRPDVDDFAFYVPNTHIVTGLHTFRIGDEQATDDLVDQPGRTECNHETN